MKNKIIIAGGSGFLGGCIAEHFSRKDFQVVILSRKEKPAQNKISFRTWDTETLGDWQSELEGALCVINLTGKSVNCRYNENNKKEILDSRVNSTSIIGKAIQNRTSPPEIWMNAASATIYRHAEDREQDESSGEIGRGFSVEVCKAWENAFHSFETPHTRKIALRISMVLSARSGVMIPMMNLVRAGMGGAMAGGKQFISWIHQDDFVRMIDWIMQHEEMSGPINISSPGPVTNSQFMAVLRKEMKVPFGIPQAKWMLQLGAFLLGTETELILKSRRVVSLRMKQSGFQFTYPGITSAVQEIIRHKK